MQSRLLHQHGGARTFILVFEHGEHVMPNLLEFVRNEAVETARISGIGALESATLGYFDWQSKEYEQRRINMQVELLSLAGDVAMRDDEPQVHAHVVLGCRDTTTRGGHLIDAVVRPTLELIVEDAPVYLRRQLDEETGLALVAPHA